MAQKPALNTNIHTIFSTDTDLEEDGAWVPVNDLWGLKIKVRRIGADKVQKANERIMKERFGEGSIRKNADMSHEEGVALVKELIAKAVLVDWENLRDADTGELIEYSPEMARELVEIKDFRDFVYQAANQRETFRKETDEEAEGN